MSDAQSDAPKNKGKGMLFAIIGAVVLLGGGGAAYALLGGKKDDEHAKEAEHAAPVKLPAQFIEMNPPFVVNFEGNASARFLQVQVQLMTRELEMKEFLEHNAPIIRNDLLLLFGNKKVEEVNTTEGKEALRAAALEAVRKIIKDEGGKPEALENIYFTSFVMQ
jgi:flagellar protein FliL